MGTIGPAAILRQAADIITAGESPDMMRTWAHGAEARTSEDRPTRWYDEQAASYCVTAACCLSAARSQGIEVSIETQPYIDEYPPLDEAVSLLALHWVEGGLYRGMQFDPRLWAWNVAQVVNDRVADSADGATEIAGCLRALADDPTARHSACAPWRGDRPRGVRAVELSHPGSTQFSRLPGNPLDIA